MSILDKIVETRKIRIAEAKILSPFSSLNRNVEAPKPFFNPPNEVTLIAECKKGSPSRGVMIDNYVPQNIAPLYEKGGATAISVLTEPDFFFGSDDHLRDVRKKVSLPILRKDFFIDKYQIREAWAMGADAILLIAAVLNTDELIEFNSIAHEYGLQTLLEVHNKEELKKSIDVEADGFGINARDLKDFSIDLEAVKEMCSMLPENKVAVAESGLKSPEAGNDMFNAGFKGFLVGEYFITSDNKADTVKHFKEALK